MGKKDEADKRLEVRSRFVRKTKPTRAYNFDY